MASESFTAYWARDRVNALKKLPPGSAPFSLLFGGPHISQPSFKRAGVRTGDWIFPVSVERGRFQVLGRMRVTRIEPESKPMDIEELRQIDAATDKLIGALGWPDEVAYRSLRITCTEEIIHGEQGSGPFLDLYLDGQDVVKLRYRSRRGERTPKGVLDDGAVASSLSFQGIYRLAPASAGLLTQAIDLRARLSSATRQNITPP